jgi:hypothetical protein
VTEAQWTEKLPPHIRPEELRGELQKPNLADLMGVLGMHHLVRCAECMYRDCKSEVPDEMYQGFPETEGLQPNLDDVDDMVLDTEAWRDRFDFTAYTTLLLGAVLARAYNEPFSPGTAYDSRLSLRRKISIASAEGAESIQLSPAEIDYMLEFPVCHLLVDVDKQSGVFGDLAHWFIGHVLEDSRTRRPYQPTIPTGLNYRKLFNAGPDSWPETTPLSQLFLRGSPGEGKVVFRAVMQCIHMYHFLDSWLGSDHNPRLHGVPWRAEVPVVLHGVFQPEIISLPLDARDAVWVISGEKVDIPSPDIELAFDALFDAEVFPVTTVAGGTGIIASDTYPLTFFAFLLARDFKLRHVNGVDGFYWGVVEVTS